jgi:cell volume regulation protein A
MVLDAQASMRAELHATDLALLVVGVLLLACVAAGRLSSRSGVPVLVLFLALGMIAGSEGLGGIHFENYALTYRIGTIALVVILFNGGMRTPVSVLREGLAPATALATLGVLVTAAIVAAGARLFGLSWGEGLLLAAVVSSTDAAAVFSVLAGSGLHLKERVAAVVEMESGLNDPTAALLTVAVVTEVGEGQHLPVGRLALGILAQLAIGAAMGAAFGFAARLLVQRIRLGAGGLYPVLTLAVALVTYGATSLASGSGFLAVYVAGFVLASASLPNRASLLRVHDFIAWTGQMVMFVVLGLLVFPSRIFAVAPQGLELAALLAFVARPIAVLVCLAPFGFPLREMVLIGWAGLRGAVPIILAVIPVLARVRGAETVFDVVFFVVLASALAQGGTVRWLTHWLKLRAGAPPGPAALLEIESTRRLKEEIASFFIAPACAVCDAAIADIPLPDRSGVVLVVRAGALLAPSGDMVLRDGDHVFVFCRPEDAPLVRLLFGRSEE